MDIEDAPRRADRHGCKRRAPTAETPRRGEQQRRDSPRRHAQPQRRVARATPLPGSSEKRRMEKGRGASAHPPANGGVHHNDTTLRLASLAQSRRARRTPKRRHSLQPSSRPCPSLSRIVQPPPRHSPHAPTELRNHHTALASAATPPRPTRTPSGATGGRTSGIGGCPYVLHGRPRNTLSGKPGLFLTSGNMSAPFPPVRGLG